MADEPKIILDDPPVVPFDVAISLDSPPVSPRDVPIALDGGPSIPFDVPISLDGPSAKPFDVPISLDAPPKVPFDVPISLDGLPSRPFDVAISLDDAPKAPFDVSINPDRPPTAPFDVPVTLDLPPKAPFDVSVTLDSPPAVPHDVSTNPDSPPAVPHDVATLLDTPPAVPFNVPIALDTPPAIPFNVPITLSAPPATPHDVAINPDLSPPNLTSIGSPGSKITLTGLIESIKTFDYAVGTLIAGIADVEIISAGGPGGGALDPRALARWLTDYKASVGAEGLIKFVAEQQSLYAMNPVTARVFDPSYFLKILVPGGMGHLVSTLDVEAGATADKYALAQDELIQLKVNSFPGKPLIANSRPDVFGPENTYTDGQDFTVDDMVDAILDDGPHLYISKDADGLSKFDATKYFESRSRDGSMNAKPTVKAIARSGISNVLNSKLAASAFTNGIVRVGVKGEQADGSVMSPTPDPSDAPFFGGVEDDDARVPLVFTDLRKDTAKNAYRSIYFRPLNLGFSNSISPSYAETNAFGRVDAVVGYQQTARTFSLSFEVHAFAPEDLRLMYNKMVWLQSMCYPTFGPDSIIRSGPVCRLRIGDAVSTQSGGVPGVIKSLNFDFADALWELKQGMKVPRSFKVSVDYLALHDGPLGFLNGVFGVFQLPPNNGTPGQDTSSPGGPQTSQEGLTPVAKTVRGGFSQFGEPRKG